MATTTEQQELQLRVTLTDEASVGLARLRQEINELAQGSGKAALDKFKQSQADLGKQIKDLAVGTTRGTEGLMRYIGRFGAAGAAMGSLAATIVIGMRNLNEFSKAIIDLTNK